MVKKNLIALSALSFAIIFALALNVMATGTFLACLRDGEIIKFSQCNSGINNYRCTKTTCQICVNEISNGVYCQANPKACKDACVYIYNKTEPSPVITPDEDAPIIELISPEQSFKSEAGLIYFKFMTTRSNSGQSLQNCNLLLNGNIVATKRNSIKYSPTQNVISYSVKDGSYAWRVECELWETVKGTTTLKKTGTISSPARSLAIGEQSGGNNEAQASISLIAPQDNYAATGEQQVQFSFGINSADLSKITGCNLILDGTKINMELSSISQQNSYPYTIAVGTHTWSVECMMGEGVVFGSDVSRNLIINQDAPSGGGGSSGGGGGSSGGGGGSSGGGGGIVSPTYTISAQELSDGISKPMTTGARIKFVMGNATHYIKAESITSSTAKITVMSTPKTFMMQKGEEKKVDVDDDGENDISITLKNLTTGKAEISVQSISGITAQSTGEATGEGSSASEAANETSGESVQSGEAVTGASVASRIKNIAGANYIAIIIVLAAIVAVAVYYSRRARKKEEDSE